MFCVQIFLFLKLEKFLYTPILYLLDWHGGWPISCLIGDLDIDIQKLSLKYLGFFQLQANIQDLLQSQYLIEENGALNLRLKELQAKHPQYF